ncbi:MAG TPA: DUF4190 domain-containing protein [Candidatus Saccharimonadales bacterium]
MTQIEVPTPAPEHPPAQPVPAQEPQNDLAMASMVLGLVSFAGFGILTGLPAIIMGIIALKRPGGHGFSITGIITGAITTVFTILGIALFIILIAVAANAPESDDGFDTRDEPYQNTLVPGST